MRTRNVAALLAAVSLTFGGGTAPASAAGQQVSLRTASSQVAAAAATLSQRVILPELSGDGPALTSVGSETVIAWTGTDAEHHLNVESSGDGLSYGNKRILGETSPFRPDVALASEGGAVAVAWTGTDSNHTLNVLYDVYGSAKKLTLWGESSVNAPALLIGPGMYLAWTGTDPNHTLNVLALSVTPAEVVAGAKAILWGESSDAGPRLARGSATVIALAWTSRSQQLRAAAATSPAALQPGASLAEWSASTPAASLLGPFLGVGNQQWIAWTGTDAVHHLNLTWTTAYPTFPNPPAGKTMLDDTALAGPALSFNGANLIAWTGTDAAHHLNVAKFLNAPAACVPAPGVLPVTPVVISHGTPNTKVVSLTFDSDHGSAGNATSYLDTLQRYGIHATFFLTGAFAQANPGIVQRMVSAGHDVGNHTVDHADLANPVRTDTFICNELAGASSALVSVSGRSPRPYFRPPYGSYNAQVVSLAGDLGYETIMWSIDPRDWDSATSVQDILNRVLNSPNLGSGAIILMHVNSVNEPVALPQVISGLASRGYTIVPLSQLI
jgi:peptidoglycan/xylan/chitin deacetylase (PgdA/CDA1 family)